MKTLTVQEVLALPASTDLPTAGLAFGLSRTSSYRAARAGTFPVTPIRVGGRWVVTRAALLAALGIKDNREDPADAA